MDEKDTHTSRNFLDAATVIDGKYRIKSVLGQGGMGEVYLAEQLALGRQVAIKKLRSILAGDRDSIVRFHREARAAGSIGHDNICEVTDLGTCSDGAPYMVMPVLKGTSFAGLIERETVSLYRLVDILSQTLDALSAAHAAGIVHRDLKPDNIYITQVGDRDDFVKMLDFGISKMMHTNNETVGRLTHTGAVMGTPAYMAPEQARGADELDHRVDIYAVGVMMYEAVTGELPFQADSYNAVMYRILTAPFDPPTVLNKDVPSAIERVILTAMSRDPLDRYSSAAEMKQAINDALSDPATDDYSFQTVERRTSGLFGDEEHTSVGTITPMAKAITGSSSASSGGKYRWPLIAAALFVLISAIGLVVSWRGSSPGAETPPVPASADADAASAVGLLPEPTLAIPSGKHGEPTSADASSAPPNKSAADAPDTDGTPLVEHGSDSKEPEPVVPKRRIRRRRPRRPVQPAVVAPTPKPPNDQPDNETISGRFGTEITTTYDD